MAFGRHLFSASIQSRFECLPAALVLEVVQSFRDSAPIINNSNTTATGHMMLRRRDSRSKCFAGAASRVLGKAARHSRLKQRSGAECYARRRCLPTSAFRAKNKLTTQGIHTVTSPHESNKNSRVSPLQSSSRASSRQTPDLQPSRYKLV